MKFKMMQRVPRILAGLAVLASGGFRLAAQSDLEPVRLTLETFAQQLETENLQILLNREGMEEAYQLYLQRKAALYPQVDLNVQQGRNQFVNVGRGFNIPGVDLRSPPSNRFDATVTGEVSLLSTEKYANFRLAKLGHEISQLDFETVRQDVLELGLTAYIQHKRNLAGLEVIDSNIERNETLLDLATDRFEAGVATQIDVTRAEVSLANAQQQRLQQETVVLQSELQIKQLLNIDLDRPLQLADFREEIDAAPGNLAQVTSDPVWERRTEYQAAVRSQEQNTLARKAAGWQRLPDVALTGQWGYASQEFLDGNEEETWSIALRLSMPLFEGFRIRSEKLQAESRIRSQELAIRQLENQIGSEYRLLVKDVRSRFDQIAVARKTMDLSQRELDLATTRFQQGVADNTEVVDAQNNLANAEDNLVEAYFRYGVARLALARAMGDVKQVLEL